MDNSCFFFFPHRDSLQLRGTLLFSSVGLCPFHWILLAWPSCFLRHTLAHFIFFFHSFFFFPSLSLSLNNKSGRHSGISSQSSQFHVSKATTTPTTSEKRLISPASPFRLSLVRVHFLSVSTLYHYHHDAAEAGQRAEAARSGREA